MTLPSPRPFQVNPCIKSSLYRKQYSCFLSRCNDISPSVPVRTYTRPFPSSVRTDQYGNRNTAWNEGVWLAKNCSRDPSVSSHLSISLSLSLSPSISLSFFLFFIWAYNFVSPSIQSLFPYPVTLSPSWLSLAVHNFLFLSLYVRTLFITTFVYMDVNG